MTGQNIVQPLTVASATILHPDSITSRTAAHKVCRSNTALADTCSQHFTTARNNITRKQKKTKKNKKKQKKTKNNKKKQKKTLF